MSKNQETQKAIFGISALKVRRERQKKERNLILCMEMVKATIPSLRSPIILFTYYNPILYLGIEKFLTQIVDAGVAGLVVPDLPLEEAQGLLQPAYKMGIDVTLLVAPTSSTERIEAIARSSQGFIYLGARHLSDGQARSPLQSRVSDLLKQIRGVTDKQARCWLWYFPARTSSLMCAPWARMQQLLVALLSNVWQKATQNKD